MNMKEYLRKENVAENEEQFKYLLRTYIKRDGANVEELIKKLESSDFFYAPATTQYYGAFYGGLCEHSLCVFQNLVTLVERSLLQNSYYDGELCLINPDSKLFESLVIIGLLHDICKMNRYIPSVKNVKHYNRDGKQHDAMGDYDWVSVSTYQSKPIEERFVYGTDGETSEFMIRQYIPLTFEESIAIINTKGDTDNNSNRGSQLASIFNKYDLPVLLHCADMLACYIDDLTQETNYDKYDEQNTTETVKTLQEGENPNS